jgi:hypothetical protein
MVVGGCWWPQTSSACGHCLRAGAGIIQCKPHRDIVCNSSLLTLYISNHYGDSPVTCSSGSCPRALGES